MGYSFRSWAFAQFVWKSAHVLGANSWVPWGGRKEYCERIRKTVTKDPADGIFNFRPSALSVSHVAQVLVLFGGSSEAELPFSRNAIPSSRIEVGWYGTNARLMRFHNAQKNRFYFIRCVSL